jgi:hypothetical protein
MSNATVTFRRIELPDDMSDDDGDQIAIVARATISLPYGAVFITGTIDSPGLWGIEAEADEDYKEEVYRMERLTLLDLLQSLHTVELPTE